MLSNEITVFTDGGSQGRIAWVIYDGVKVRKNLAKISPPPSHGWKRVHQTEGIAILRALHDVAPSSKVRLISDSKAWIRTLRGLIGVRSKFLKSDPQLTEILEKIRELVKAKKLSIEYVWRRRGKNYAGRLIERSKEVSRSMKVDLNIDKQVTLEDVKEDWSSQDFWQEALGKVKQFVQGQFDLSSWEEALGKVKQFLEGSFDLSF